MATQAQIAANRRNALRSTGPTSPAGRARSSRNAAKHGLSAEISAQEIAAEYQKLTGARMPNDMDAVDIGALRMARAEIMLRRARDYEQSLFLQGDDALRMLAEIDMVREVINWDDFLSKYDAMKTLSEAEYHIGRLKHVGTRCARQYYKRAKRYLREAELEHQRALAAWRPA